MLSDSCGLLLRHQAGYTNVGRNCSRWIRPPAIGRKANLRKFVQLRSVWSEARCGTRKSRGEGWGGLQGTSPHFLNWHEIAKMRVVGEYSGGLIVDDP